MKRAFITGITGQDGSYLAELLLSKGYEVHGLIRRSSTFNTERIDHLYKDSHDPEARVYLHYGDLSVSGQLTDLLSTIQPHEIYNLGAQSHVRVSFNMPEYTGDITGLGTLRLLEAIRKTGIQTKFYQASSSEMFGAAPPPQSEETPFQPQSPYAAAKVYAYYVVKNYRDAYNLLAWNGILFNHESPRRGETFVTRKVTRAATRIKLGLQKKLYLGNTKAKRDWGFAGDYVEAMWLMLQQDNPDDYVIAYGETHSVSEFVEKVFQKLDLDYREYVEIDKRYFRPTEVDVLLGDSSKAKKNLGWQPKVGFDALIDMMIAADMELAAREKTLRDAGYECSFQGRS
ncbi:MAG TPA: GDP-mannose 4,6-dehydratase [Syntrophorhabdus sp.]|jgi:GDPmannose 4,6-dehydratase|nr:GDP-mannose 4,6-dehydratase [Syntrophorhabdus sp.]OPX96741.1 MAG: GDP-mannose 4,6-dehydratase [Syntrophorhabdus sp. PtaB.Bin027]OQB74962.1 MAG: GDP-mannose 4,6-dehydratase [Deltaproteobacteria bacterium ADurb.Bin135]HOD77820.1 GDP-mannose 4,6-dehydratase [Syntrophorhabdus sp.]HQG26827.1 GDP-mannose 4,6-dehydratase [Syntrophorhabdus sp.]